MEMRLCSTPSMISLRSEVLVEREIKRWPVLMSTNTTGLYLGCRSFFIGMGGFRRVSDAAGRSEWAGNPRCQAGIRKNRAKKSPAPAPPLLALGAAGAGGIIRIAFSEIDATFSPL